jgi:hypothetical protein
LTAAIVDAAHLSVHVRVAPTFPAAVRERADLVVALTQDHVTNDVVRGENHGRKLEHSAVVRSLTALGSLEAPARTLEKTATLALDAGWDLRHLSMIGLLQERRSRHIVGAGAARVITLQGASPSGE